MPPRLGRCSPIFQLRSACFRQTKTCGFNNHTRNFDAISLDENLYSVKNFATKEIVNCLFFCLFRRLSQSNDFDFDGYDASSNHVDEIGSAIG